MAPEPAGLCRPGKALTAASLLAVILGGVIQVWLSGPRRIAAIVAVVTFLGLLALLASIRRAMRPSAESAGWGILSLSLLIMSLVQGIRVLSILGLPLPSLISNVSIGFAVLATSLQIPALLAWHLAPRSRFDRIRNGLDGLLFALAIFFIAWAVVLGPAFLSDRFPLADRLIWLATFLIYDLLLGLALYLGLSEPARFNGPLGWLAGAFLIASLHNLLWLLKVLSGAPLSEYPSGPPIALLVPLAYLGAALSPRPLGSSGPTGDQPSVIHVVPYLPVLGATLLGVWLLATRAGAGHHPLLIWLGIGMAVVLLVRQYLALHDFSILSQHLETRVVERTEALEKAQMLLLRTERLKSMAALGAGLTHDMNNLLCAIQSRADLVIMDLDEGKVPRREDMVRMQEVTVRAASMSRRLMNLGRQEPEPPQAMDLAEQLVAMQPLLQLLLPRNLKLQLENVATVTPFLGSRDMLEQILVNLVGNARDAMPDGGTVTLRIRTPGPEDSAKGPLLEIEDTGTGIPENLQERVFEPFFTTKAAGMGTGLGLMSVKSLLQKAGGSISFSSRIGQGTTFQVRLPRLP